MLFSIIVIQITVFLFFFAIERIFPARKQHRQQGFSLLWVFVNVFATGWANVALNFYIDFGRGPIYFDIGLLYYGCCFYLIYSFVNYWYHRVKHSNAFLWRNLHRFHHSTTQMETAVTFYKHPFEYIANSVVVLTLAWVFSVPFEAIAMALAIEGCLECFHHSNIKLPKKLDWIGWVIQTPKMHLIHHQRGLHRYNYVAFLWDSVFGTAIVYQEFEGKLGFNDNSGALDNIFRKKA